jgi:hypothetical protein
MANRLEEAITAIISRDSPEDADIQKILALAAIANDNPAENNTFTRGAMFGLFLTLSFCLLSQPYGSLVYRSQCGVFWRLSPLACIYEAAIIFLELAATVITTVRRVLRRRERMRQTQDGGSHWKGLWQELRSALWVGLHATSAALLLVRADVDRHPDEKLMELLTVAMGDGQSANGLDPEASEDDTYNDADDVANESTLEPHTIPLASLSRSGTSEAAQDAPIESDNNGSTTAQTTAMDTTSTTDQGGSFIRRTTNQLEQGRPTRQQSVPTEGVPRLLDGDRLASLRKALGSNAIAHRELPVQIVTFLSAAGSAVKLCADNIPLVARIAGLFMLSAWLATQILLILFHAQRVDDQSMARIVRHTRSFLAASKEGPLKITRLRLIIPGLVPLPPLFYLCVVAAAGRSNPLPYWNALDTVLDAPSYIGFIMVPLCFLIPCLNMGDFLDYDTRNSGIFVQIVRGLLVLIVFLLFIASLFFFPCFYMVRYKSEDSTFTPSMESWVDILVMFGYYFFLISISCIFFVLGLLIFFSRTVPQREDNDNFDFAMQLLNGFFTLITFITFLANYNEADTNQPDWVSWFG